MALWVRLLNGSINRLQNLIANVKSDNCLAIILLIKVHIKRTKNYRNLQRIWCRLNKWLPLSVHYALVVKQTLIYF